MAKSISCSKKQEDAIIYEINSLIDLAKFGEGLTENHRAELITKAYSEILKYKNVYNGQLRKRIMPGYEDELLKVVDGLRNNYVDEEDDVWIQKDEEYHSDHVGDDELSDEEYFRKRHQHNGNNILTECLANYDDYELDSLAKEHQEGATDNYFKVYMDDEALKMEVVNTAFTEAWDRYVEKGTSFMKLFFATLGICAKDLGRVRFGKVLNKRTEIARFRTAKAKEYLKGLRKSSENKSYRLPEHILSREAFHEELRKLNVSREEAEWIVDDVFGISEQDAFSVYGENPDEEDSKYKTYASFTTDDTTKEGAYVVIYKVYNYVKSKAEHSKREKSVFLSYVDTYMTYKLYMEELCKEKSLESVLYTEFLDWLESNAVKAGKGKIHDKAYLYAKEEAIQTKLEGRKIRWSVLNNKINRAHKKVDDQFPGRVIGRYNYFDEDKNIHSDINWDEINKLRDICNDVAYRKAVRNIRNVEKENLEAMAFLLKKGWC